MRTDTNLIEAYLLGELEEEDRIAVENRMFKDDEFFDRLEFFEDELIEAYVHRKLSPTQHRHFEENFLLSPRRKHRLALLQALEKHFEDDAKSPAAGSSWWANLKNAFRVGSPSRGLAFAGCALALVFAVLSTWLTARLVEERNLAARQQQKLEQLQRDARRRDTTGQEQTHEAISPPVAENVTVAAFVLVPGLFRGPSSAETEQILAIPPQTETIRLSLQSHVEVSGGKYRVVIRTDGGDQVWQQDQQVPGGNRSPLVVGVPVRILSAGRYRLNTLAFESDGRLEPLDDYEFAVKR